MPRGKPEQAEHIIPKLREVEVELGRGKTVAEAVKRACRVIRQSRNTQRPAAANVLKVHNHRQPLRGGMRFEMLQVDRHPRRRSPARDLRLHVCAHHNHPLP